MYDINIYSVDLWRFFVELSSIICWRFFVELASVGCVCRPEILKQELKVFFVKYNDPVYVKLEKLDIMIRLTNQANIAQVLAELKESVPVLSGLYAFL